MSPGPEAAADATSLGALEFPAVVEMLAAHASFAPSRELALGSLPSGEPGMVRILQDQTDEAARLLDDQAQTTIGGARDVRGTLERAARGGRVSPAELLEVADTLRATAQFGARLRGWRGSHLSGVRSELDDAPALRERIERTVDEGGEILDSASPELAAIRRRLRAAQERVRERLNAMVRATEHAGTVAEPIVTMRSGRYVIPIRTEAKGRIKGIVHDQSSSGATLFIEPLSVVELNNAWAEATLAQEREEERILDEVSREVESRAASLGASLAALARADLWLARARLGSEMDAMRPAESASAVELLTARHPLLSRAAVPIDLRIGEVFGYRAVIITGPNTGGKTVSLKTLGLLSLMHQAGLRIPAAGGSRTRVFGRVMADIGDEQSIAQSLSTFSSHLRNVVRFVREADADSLVLLDEIGAGTDPTEGSALAMAVVSRLLERGATVLATTHYADLKTFAETHPGVTNASVEFDVDTLRPTYRLSIGLPGKSQAFAIAARLGLPEEILADARGRLSAEHATFEETLASIQRAEAEREKELARAREDRARAEAERERAEAGITRARAEAAQILRDAHRAAEELYGRAERELAEARREVARMRERAAPAQESLERLARATLERRSREPGGDGGSKSPHEAPPSEPVIAQPRPGQWARSRTLGRTGRVAEISGRTGRATLETDGARLVLPADDLEVVPEPAAGPTEADVEAEEMRRRAAARVAPQIDLRGERVEAALERLDGYLDEALMAGLDSVRVIHGAGTGALRRAIRDALAAHPRVSATRSGTRQEGGDGATVAEF